MIRNRCTQLQEATAELLEICSSGGDWQVIADPQGATVGPRTGSSGDVTTTDNANGPPIPWGRMVEVDLDGHV